MTGPRRQLRAVKDNDTKTMAAILADDFVVVEGDGSRETKADLIKSANDGSTHYEHQEDSEQTVRTPTGWSYVSGQASLPLPGKHH